MELLQMFGKLRRLKIRQGLHIVEKAIEILTRFRRGRGCAKPAGQPIQRRLKTTRPADSVTSGELVTFGGACATAPSVDGAPLQDASPPSRRLTPRSCPQ